MKMNNYVELMSYANSLISVNNEINNQFFFYSSTDWDTEYKDKVKFRNYLLDKIDELEILPEVKYPMLIRLGVRLGFVLDSPSINDTTIFLCLEEFCLLHNTPKADSNLSDHEKEILVQFIERNRDTDHSDCLLRLKNFYRFPTFFKYFERNETETRDFVRVSPENISFVNNPTKELCEYAVGYHGHAIGYIPKKFQTKTMIRKAYRTNNFILTSQIINGLNVPEDLFEHFAKEQPVSYIKSLDEKRKTIENSKIALKLHPELINYFNDNPELIEYVASFYGIETIENIDDVNDENFEVLCKIASQNGRKLSKLVKEYRLNKRLKKPEYKLYFELEE